MPQKMTVEKLATMVKMRRDGATLREIGIAIGVTQTCVWHYLERLAKKGIRAKKRTSYGDKVVDEYLKDE